MKASFELELFDDEETRKKLPLLSRIEAAFDDARNHLPAERDWFADHMPLGSRVKFTMEWVPSPTAKATAVTPEP